MEATDQNCQLAKNLLTAGAIHIWTLPNARAFRQTVDELAQPWTGMKIDKVAGIEARGFILGGAGAHQVSAGLIPIRKKGKLRVSIVYSLEYGIDEMELHASANS